MKSPFSLSSKYNSLAAIILVALVLSLLIIGLLMRPAWGRLKTLGTEIPQVEANREQAKQTLANLESGKKYFEDNDTSVERINTAVPGQPNVPSVLVILDSLSKANGVTLTAFTPQQLGTPSAGAAAVIQTLTDGASTVEITASYTGYYESMIRFFYALERNLRIVDVKTISFNGVGGTGSPTSSAATTPAAGGAPPLTGSITFKVYYKLINQPAASPPPATGGPK